MQPAQVPAAAPVDPAQRERAMLLRSFESSPLSKANFCALKGLAIAELDAVLAQARQEHTERPPQAAPEPQREWPERQERHGDRPRPPAPHRRGPRSDGGPR